MRILLVLLLSLAALDATAASFPCAKAKSKVEKLICADAGLSKLDEELAAAFRHAATDWDATAEDQRNWLSTRDRCNTKVCLARVYRARIEVLKRWHDPEPWSPRMDGRYFAYHRIYLANDSGKNDPLDLDDCLSIAAGADGTTRLRLHTNQVNGHSCTLDMKVVREGGGYRVVPEAGDACELKVHAERGLIVVEDPQHSCQDHCGARAHIDGLAYGRATHEPGRCEFEQ